MDEEDKNENEKLILDKEDEEDKQEIENIMKEEDINLVPEDIDVKEIDKLTGVPKGKDILLFAIPMLAPYPAI